MDEDNLIRKAQAGDAAAFSALLERHYDTLYRFAYKWCGNRDDAQDITQQACIMLARKIGSFRFESAFTSWLYAMVINCAKDWYRSQQRHHATSGEMPGELHSPETHEVSVYLRQVLQLLDAMAEGFKETAILVHGIGLSHADAASILGIKESTVSWRLHEIRQHLQTLDSGEIH